MRDQDISGAAPPIDVVIAWVDGNDQGLVEKRNVFLGGERYIDGSAAHSTRFASVNEIKYCLLSIFAFAPFVRNVFIVTDGQDPQLWNDIEIHFPERMGSVRIVDHKEIFEGFEECLPTFNSISIGNMIWRIKGISENFVYFNDDIFLVRRILPTDWFVDGKPVLRGKWAIPPFHQMAWSLVCRFYHRVVHSGKGYSPRAYFYTGQWNSASLVGFRGRYFACGHTPHAVSRGEVEDFFHENMPLFKRNISFRFRNFRQFTFISLSNHLQLFGGNGHIANPDVVFLEPYIRSGRRLEREIGYCERDRNIKFICVQSLEMWRPEDRRKIFRWMERIMQLKSLT